MGALSSFFANSSPQGDSKTALSHFARQLRPRDVPPGRLACRGFGQKAKTHRGLGKGAEGEPGAASKRKCM